MTRRRYPRLQERDLPHDTVALAKALIGLVLVSQRDEGLAAGRIVEVEAYVDKDEASHAYRGQTARNASMFLAAFHAYIYKIYGTSFCFNVTAQAAGVGEAVLVRALQPLDGLPLMMHRRGTQTVRDLCRGPGRLAMALAITPELNGCNLLTDGRLYLARDADASAVRVRKSTRIGITKAAHRHLRFYEAGSPFVSGPKWLSP